MVIRWAQAWQIIPLTGKINIVRRLNVVVVLCQDNIQIPRPGYILLRWSHYIMLVILPSYLEWRYDVPWERQQYQRGIGTDWVSEYGKSGCGSIIVPLLMLSNEPNLLMDCTQLADVLWDVWRFRIQCVTSKDKSWKINNKMDNCLTLQTLWSEQK